MLGYIYKTKNKIHNVYYISKETLLEILIDLEYKHIWYFQNTFNALILPVY